MIAETLGIFAGGYALLVGGLAVFQRDMIYHPAPAGADPQEAGVPEMAPVPVRTIDGILVTGWYGAPPSPTAPVVMFFQGNAGTLAHRAPKARAFLDAGYGVYLVGYRGYGGNPGRPSEAGLYADARAAVSWLHLRGIPPDRVILYGESLGTGIATQIAYEHDDFAALILEAPFTRLPELAPPCLLPGMADLLMVDRYDSLTRIAHNKAPLLVLHGEHDGVVPVEMGRRILDAATVQAKEGAFLPKASHNDTWEHGGKERVFDFLERTKPAPSPAAAAPSLEDQAS